MAVKGTIPVPPTLNPSPADLAREAAEEEKKQHIAQLEKNSDNNEEVKPKKVKSAFNVELDMNNLMEQNEVRKTATFSISVSMHDELTRAANRLGTSRSAVLEQAFKTWWTQAQKFLDETGK